MDIKLLLFTCIASTSLVAMESPNDNQNPHDFNDLRDEVNQLPEVKAQRKPTNEVITPKIFLDCIDQEIIDALKKIMLSPEQDILSARELIFVPQLINTKWEDLRTCLDRAYTYLNLPTTYNQALLTSADLVSAIQPPAMFSFVELLCYSIYFLSESSITIENRTTGLNILSTLLAQVLAVARSPEERARMQNLSNLFAAQEGTKADHLFHHILRFMYLFVQYGYPCRYGSLTATTYATAGLRRYYQTHHTYLATPLGEFVYLINGVLSPRMIKQRSWSRDEEFASLIKRLQQEDLINTPFFGATPLYYAIIIGNLKAVLQLLAAGANPFAIYNAQGISALEIVDMLLQEDPELDQELQNNYRAIQRTTTGEIWLRIRDISAHNPLLPDVLITHIAPYLTGSASAPTIIRRCIEQQNSAQAEQARILEELHSYNRSQLPRVLQEFVFVVLCLISLGSMMNSYK